MLPPPYDNKDPMVFIARIAKMQTFAEYQREATKEEELTARDLAEICDSANKDDDWLMNDSADLEELIMQAREIMEMHK